jgi:hypothetical protein
VTPLKGFCLQRLVSFGGGGLFFFLGIKNTTNVPIKGIKNKYVNN